MPSIEPNRVFGSNSGTWSVIGASRSTTPSSASFIAAMAVNSFDTDPARYTVDAVATFPADSSAKPNPSLHTTRRSSTRATLIPVKSCLFMRAGMYSSRYSMAVE